MARIIDPGVFASPGSEYLNASEDTQDSEAGYIGDVVAENGHIITIARPGQRGHGNRNEGWVVVAYFALTRQAAAMVPITAVDEPKL
jgi:hypothetical protein